MRENLMDTKDLNDLKGNPKNPRTISKHDFEALKKSILKFGDLSGVIFNKRTGHLAGGHQRIEAFKALTGQTEDEIGKLLDMVGASGESNSEEDEAPEVDNTNPAVSKLGEIYQLGSHRLMCGDATDFGQVSDLFNGQKMDLVYTDPPYG